MSDDYQCCRGYSSQVEKLQKENEVHKESRANLENWNDILVDKNSKLESELAESKRQVQEQKNEIVEIRREWDRLYSLYLLEVAKNEKSEAVLSKHKLKGEPK